MANPATARQYEPEDENSIKPVTRPNLRVVDGGSNGNEPTHPSLKVLEGGSGTPHSDGSSNDTNTDNGHKALSPDALKQGEEGATLGGGLGSEEGLFNPSDTESQSSLLKLVSNKATRKRALIGGGVGVGIIVSIIASFLAILPLKILHIVTGVENHFFASSKTALENETENLFSGYIKNQVLPGLTGTCQSTRVNKSCAVVAKDTSPVANLYNAWRNNNLENKLATKYGIEFETDGKGRYYMRALTNSGSTGVFRQDITAFKFSKDGDLFAQLSRSQVRQEVRTALENETLFDRVVLRFKVGKLLESKYGIKRCIIACDVRDKFADSVATKKLAAKALLINRVIEPRSATLAVVISCLLTSCNVIPETNTSAATVAVDTATNGEPLSYFDSQVQSKLDSYAETLGSEKLADLVSKVEDIKKAGGFQNYVLQLVIEKALGVAGVEGADEIANKTVPVVGWVNLAATAITFVHSAGPNIKRFAYVTNAASMVALYAMYRTSADEMKSGHTDATELGSLTDSLGPNTKSNDNGAMTGATAESTPLYKNIIDSSSTPSPTVALSGLVPRAYAATASSTSLTNSQYKCDNSQPVPSGKLICDEQSLKFTNFLTNLSDTFNSIPGFNTLAGIAGIAKNITGVIGNVLSPITDIAGKILSPIAKLIGKIPGVTNVADFVGQTFKKGINAIVNFLIPPGVTPNMDGGHTVDALIGGGDVAYNEAGHRFGGRLLSPQQVADNINQQAAERANTFSNKSLFARVFDASSDQSLISKVALNMPTNISGLATSSFAGLLTNPLNKLSYGFSSMFVPTKAFAAATPQADPFGVDQYGFPANDPVFSKDPQTYWKNQRCDDPKTLQDWNNSAVQTQNLNPDTLEPRNTTTNPCLLIQTAAAGAGGLFSDSVLSASDLGGSSGP